MPTTSLYSPRAIDTIYDHVTKSYRSMREGGIAANKPGYHNSRVNNSPSDYSVQAPADKRGDGGAASAIDITLDSPAEMRLATKRLIDACKSNDKRIHYCREVIGTLDSKNVITYNRWPTGTGSRSRTGVLWGASDSTHLWHVHISFFRDYATDNKKMLGIAEVVNGLKPGALTGDKDYGSKQKKRVATPTGRRKVQIRAGAREGGWFWGTRYIKASEVNKARAKVGKFSRHIWFVQAWLEDLGYHEVTGVEATGFWNQKTQKAYDNFRRSQGWTGSDARGSVGVASLTALQKAANTRSRKKIRN